ncbi:hypothetical protein STENM36S_03330 [Streptomyces tendae]
MAASRFGTKRPAARAAAAATTRSAAARAAVPGSDALQQGHPADSTPAAPVAGAPTTATTRTGVEEVRSATAVPPAAVASNTAVSVCGPAPTAIAHSSRGRWAVATASGRGWKSPSRTPYAAHSAARTADAAAVYPTPSVPVNATSWSA